MRLGHWPGHQQGLQRFCMYYRCSHQQAAAENNLSDVSGNEWHQKIDLRSEDRSGCDHWFMATIEEINRTLGSELKVETLESLPEGGTRCVRRIWVEV